MSAVRQDHPDRRELDAFGVGLLEPVRSAVVAAHLGACETCSEAVLKAPDDTLVSRLREAAAAPPDAPPDDLARHPRYRLLKPLGRGGMGVVYLAEHAVMRRPVALKVVNREYTANPAAVERFRREIRAAARLHHPNIVAAYDAEQAGQTHILVMEYVDGVSLDRLVAERGPMPVAEACEYARQAALGLQHAHEHGLVHRDVKPHNLIRGADGVVKVLDFGLASARGSGECSLTGATVVMGTPDYIAPEQAEESRAADARSDVYALGCTLYFLLTGRPPFARRSPLRTLLAHREEEAVLPDAPPGLAAVLARMMAKTPYQRYQTAAEAAAALAAFTRPAGRPPRRRLPVAGAAAALLMAMLGAAAVIVRVPTDQGEVTVRTDDPNVELVASGAGKLVRIVDSQSKQTWELDPTKYQLSMADQPDGLTIDLKGQGAITLRRKGRSIVEISRAGAAEADGIELVRRIPVPSWADRCYWTAVSNGGTFALMSLDVHPGGLVTVFDVAAAKQTAESGGVSAAFLDDDHFVAGGDSGLGVIETRTGRRLQYSEPRSLWRLQITPDGKRLWYIGGPGIYLVDLDTLKAVHAWEDKYLLDESGLSPDGKWLMLKFRNEPWVLWDVQNNRAADGGAGLHDKDRWFYWFPDSKTACVDRDGSPTRVDVRSGESVASLKALDEPGQPVRGRYSDDGRCYVIWLEDGRFLQYRTPFGGKALGQFTLPLDDRTPPRDYDKHIVTAVSADNRFAALATKKFLYVLRLAPLPPDPE